MQIGTVYGSPEITSFDYVTIVTGLHDLPKIWFEVRFTAVADPGIGSPIYLCLLIRNTIDNTIYKSGFRKIFYSSYPELIGFNNPLFLSPFIEGKEYTLGCSVPYIKNAFQLKGFTYP